MAVLRGAPPGAAGGAGWPALAAARAAVGRRELVRAATTAATLLALLAYAAAFRATWIDDAYIQLRYARTLLESGTWGFYAGYPANTATSPLNVLLLAAAGLPLGSVERGLTLLTALELAALLWLLLRLGRRLFGGRFFGGFAFVAIAANPLVLSTIGMESLPYALLLVAAVAWFVEQRWLPLAVTLGLLTLARPDGVLLLAVMLPLAAAPLRRKGLMLLAYGATIAPWFLFSWFALGSFVPDTLLIKTGQSWGAASFADGLAVYLHHYPLETLGSLWLLPLCLFPLWQAPPAVVKLVTVVTAYALLHFALYAALDVPPYHWYYVHHLIPMLLVAAAGAGYRLGRLPPRLARLAAPAALLAPTAGLLLLAGQDGFPFTEAPINTNWATSRQYAAIAEWLDANLPPGDAVAVYGEIGTVAFFSDRYLVNEFSDMSVADGLIAQARAEAGPTTSRLLDLNFRWRRPHAPLPAPRHEFIAVPATGDFPHCPLDDPACRMVHEGTTGWVGRHWLMVRTVG